MYLLLNIKIKKVADLLVKYAKTIEDEINKKSFPCDEIEIAKK